MGNDRSKVKTKVETDPFEGYDAVLSDRLYVRTELVTNEMKNSFTEKIINPQTSDMRIIRLFRNFEGYIGFVRGDLGKIFRVFSGLKILDQRASVPLRYNLVFTGSLWENQKEMVNEWLDYEYGQIKAPARSGKTVVATALVCELRKKTLILAHMKELLDQFMNSFYNFTNVSELQRLLGKRIIGIAKDYREYEQYDICLSTYQTFITKIGVKKLNAVKESFGLVLVDECHRCPAPRYLEVVSKLNPEIRLGLTATPTRKDLMHVLGYYVIGPVVVSGKAEQLKCKVFVVRTGIRTRSFVHWNSFVNSLCNNQDRNKLILDNIEKDVNAGRHILVVTTRVKHCKYLDQELKKREISSEAYWGKSYRDKILEEARSGKIKVVIAMRQLVQQGIDVPMWDTYYCVIPIANEENYYQECSRIRTPYSGKPTPIIKYFLDSNSASFACFRIASRIHSRERFIIFGDS